MGAREEGHFRMLFEHAPISLWEEDFGEVRRFFDDLQAQGVRDLARYLDENPQAVDENLARIKVVDVNLRTGSGLDLVREIRHAPEIKDIRILMSSGLNLKQECMQAGADGFIMKPFMPDELIMLIHRTIQQ